MKNSLLLILLFLVFNSLSVNGQACFQSTPDTLQVGVNATGIKGLYNANLNMKACNLIQLVNDETSGTHDFQVYGIDLYPILAYSNEQDGLTKSFTEFVNSKATDNSNVIFSVAHQKDGRLSYNISIKFPETGSVFTTLTPIDKEAITASVLNTLRSTSTTNPGNFVFNPTVQMAGIDTLMGFFTRLIDGDELFVGGNALELAGFEELPIEEGENFTRTGDTNDNLNVDAKGNYMHDFAGIAVPEGTGTELLRKHLSHEISLLAGTTEIAISQKYILTDDQVSVANFNLAGERFSNGLGEIVMWMHYTRNGANEIDKVHIKYSDNLSDQKAEDLTNLMFQFQMEKWTPELYDPDYALPQNCSFGWKIGKECILPYIYSSSGGTWFGSPAEQALGMPFQMGIVTGLLDGLLGTIEFIYKASKGVISALWTTFTKTVAYTTELIIHGIKHRSVTKMLEKFGEDTIETIAGYVDNIKTVYTTIMDFYDNTDSAQLKAMLTNMGNSLVSWMGNTVLTTEQKTYGYYVGIVGFEFVLAAFSGGGSVGARGSKYLGKIISSITDFAQSGGKLVHNVLRGADNLADPAAKAIKARCKILGTGCFVKGTPVLMASNSNLFTLKSTGKAMAMAAAMPIVAIPIQEVQLLDYAVAHETVNAGYDLTASTNEDNIYFGLIDKDPYTSDQQRERDQYELDNENWNEVVFEEVYGNSTAKFALHNDWIDQKKYAVDRVVHMNLPEQGISGAFKITSIRHILPQKRPVDDNSDDDYGYRPVTALFTHISDQIYNIEFDNGEQLGVTVRHPIYSVTSGSWRLAGELEVGELVLTKSGVATVINSKHQEGFETVYNLEVKGMHNFLVGENGVVVHNNGLCKKEEILELVPSLAEINKLNRSGLPSLNRTYEMMLELNRLLNSSPPGPQKVTRFLDEFITGVPVDLTLASLALYFNLTDNNESCLSTLFSRISDIGNNSIIGGYKKKADLFKKRLLELPQPDLEQFCEDFEDAPLQNLRSFTFNNEEFLRAWSSFIVNGYDENIRTDIDNLYQLSQVDKYKNIIVDYDDVRKGNFGEMVGDLQLVILGYTPLHSRVTGIFDDNHHGIDCVYLKDGIYYIVEFKYGTSQIENGDPRQMSDQWINGNNRMFNAVNDQVLADQILDSEYVRVLIKGITSGAVIGGSRLLDEEGYEISGDDGIFPL